MTRYTLERRIDALENDISGADAQIRHEMIARLRRVVLKLDIGDSPTARGHARQPDPCHDDLTEAAFDNMPI